MSDIPNELFAPKGLGYSMALMRFYDLLGRLVRVPMVLALGMLLCASGFQKSRAATDDAEFNQCAKIFSQTPDALTIDLWRKPPLDADVAQFENPNLYGDFVLRWISHKNDNGTAIIVVMERDPDPQPEDDPDGFDVIFEQNGHFSLKQVVGANGVAFSREINKGVNSLLFCTRGNISQTWTWNGNNWN